MRPANSHPGDSHKSHVYVPATPAADTSQATGYVEKEYEFQEYPKHVTIGGATVEVQDAEEEARVRGQSGQSEQE